MHLIKIISLLMIACFLGCNKEDKPTPDNGPHAFDHNYPTAEFSACGKNYFGVGICDVELGSDFAQVDLKVKGYFDGDIKITSNCSIESIIHYSGHQLVSFPLNGEVKQSCLIGILVSPKFPNQDQTTIVSSGFKGFLLVSANKSGDLVYDFVSKVKAGTNARIDIPVSVVQILRTKFSGCGSSFDALVESKDGFVTVYASNILTAIVKQTCPLFGGVGTKPTTFVNWFLQIYDQEFQNISEPYFTHINDKKISIKAEDSVTAIFVNDDYVYKNEGTFKIDPSLPFTVRAITVGGRSQVGDYNPISKEVVWRK
jgi:hypothetical protein